MSEIIYVRVIPNAQKPGVIDDTTDQTGLRHLKVKVSTPPEKGKANDAVIEMLANYLGIKRNRLVIESGHVFKQKRIRIED